MVVFQLMQIAETRVTMKTKAISLVPHLSNLDKVCHAQYNAAISRIYYTDADKAAVSLFSLCQRHTIDNIHSDSSFIQRKSYF